MRAFLFVVFVSSALDPSCRGGTESAGGKDSPPTRDTAEKKNAPDAAADTVARPDPCGAAALGLGEARALAPWRPPSGCTASGSGTSVVRSAAELEARLGCPAGTAAGVDLSQYALLSVGYTLSPAGAGLVAFDDGKVITLVSRQRNPCPGDPMPMPMNATAWFLLPAAGERTLADTICTVDSTCE